MTHPSLDKNSIRAVCLALSSFAVLPGGTFAQSAFVVTPSGEACSPSPEAGLHCALGTAIEAANAVGGESVIRLAGKGRYVLTEIDHQNEGGNGLPAVTGQVVIEGEGAVIARSEEPDAPVFRLFRVEKDGALTLRGVTLQGGRTPPGFDGAAIWSTGALSAEDCVFENNISGDDGGAIRSDGTLRVAHSVFRDNKAGGRGGVGGALQTTVQFGSASSVIENTLFTGNEARATGGALWLQGETLLSGSTLRGNRAEQRGGGIQNYGALVLEKVSVSGNSAGMSAGGLATFEPVRLAASKLTGNDALIAPDCQGVVLHDAKSEVGSDVGCIVEKEAVPLGKRAAEAPGSSSEAAIAYLTERGASVIYRDERGGGPGTIVISTDGAWRGQDADFAVLEDVEGLYKLRLGGRISDEALKHLPAVRDLRELDIHAVSVTDEGVKQLASITTLKRLNLTYTKVTDEGLAALKDMRELQWLGLAYTEVSADGVDALRTALAGTIIEGDFVR